MSRFLNRSHYRNGALVDLNADIKFFELRLLLLPLKPLNGLLGDQFIVCPRRRSDRNGKDDRE